MLDHFSLARGVYLSDFFNIFDLCIRAHVIQDCMYVPYIRVLLTCILFVQSFSLTLLRLGPLFGNCRPRRSCAASRARSVHLSSATCHNFISSTAFSCNDACIFFITNFYSQSYAETGLSQPYRAFEQDGSWTLARILHYEGLRRCECTGFLLPCLWRPTSHTGPTLRALAMDSGFPSPEALQILRCLARHVLACLFRRRRS
ncbi:hypothetical protein BV25DRAFT_352168 [Artomyces pyxidatus]|uniref:Uncharacterized protein n=1 Tax=Artomyces pyxidatus TaxID=48021 RepID=A0ACB8SF91_9AGAM|nr:hypothetical protein BV25DRAFT_352168 [Artomyces pyxidatus]